VTAPTALIVETTAAEDCPLEFLGESADVVYFISFAHSERYGSVHTLSKAASVLKRRLNIDLSALLKFADANVESSEEVAALEAMWQEAGPLSACARAVAGAIDADDEMRDLTADFPELPERLRELAAMADWAAGRGAKVRLTYVL
jgi:hypothetical protein